MRNQLKLTPASCRALMAMALLFSVVATGCGSDSPTGPGGSHATVTDEVAVSLEQISIVRDCDSDGPGEFAYKFYIQEYMDGELVQTHLSESWTSFSANDNTAWDPEYTATFEVERRAGVEFRVRLSIRELDSVEHFTQGEFITHRGDDSSWMPTRGNGSVGYDIYDATQLYGEVDFEVEVDASCEASMSYSVSVMPVAE